MTLTLNWTDWMAGGVLVLFIAAAIAVFVAIARSPGGWSAFAQGCSGAMDRQAQMKKDCHHCKHGGGWPF